LIFFAKKRLFQIKTALTFASDSKKSVIYENVSTKKLHPISTAVGCLHKFLLLKIPKGNMKAGKFKILSEKMRKMIFKRIFEFLLLFLLLFSYFEVFILFLIFKFLSFFIFLNILSFKINN
jgi:hypothetical protein